MLNVVPLTIRVASKNELGMNLVHVLLYP